MSEFEVFITLILYLSFFGWIGVRRGTVREVWTFLIILGAWIGLQVVGDLIITLTNLAGKLFVGIATGVVSDLSAVAALPDLITPEYERGYLFLVWAIVVILTYISTQQLINPGRSNPGWAILMGIANGLLFASLLLPRLVALLLPEEVVASGGNGLLQILTAPDLFRIVGNGFSLIIDVAARFWETVRPQAALVVLLLFTVILALAAATLRGGSGGKKAT